MTSTIQHHLLGLALIIGLGMGMAFISAGPANADGHGASAQEAGGHDADEHAEAAPEATPEATDEAALEGSIAALAGGPADENEELALGFVEDFGLGSDLGTMLGFGATFDPEILALIEALGADKVMAAYGQQAALAEEKYQTAWKLLIARALLTEFTPPELQSYLDNGADSPYAERVETVDLSAALAEPQAALLVELTAGVVAGTVAALEAAE